MARPSLESLGRNGRGVNKTGFLFGVTALAFLVFVTARGDLPAWLGLLGLSSGAPAGGPAPGASSPLPGLPLLPKIGG